MRVALRLPQPLREAERHEYSVMTTLPPTLAMQKHYAYTPATRCDRFHLRVRFDPDRAPRAVWRVADAFHRDLDERVMDGEPLQLDGCGDLETSFEDLLPGHGLTASSGPDRPSTAGAQQRWVQRGGRTTAVEGGRTAAVAAALPRRDEEALDAGHLAAEVAGSSGCPQTIS
jgi:hypothetical protein